MYEINLQLMKFQIIIQNLEMTKLTTRITLFLLFTFITFAIEENSFRLLATTTNVNKLCASFSSRTTLVDAQAQKDAEMSKKYMQATFKVSGNSIAFAILNEQNKVGAAAKQAQTMISPLVQFVGPFAVGLVINILIWPFLLCCCCCTSCCPSKCCQKPDNEQYTKCELIWPAAVLIVALLLIIVPSIIGLSRASDVQKSFEAVSCSAAITFNDLLNGNTSATGKFFVGLSPLVDGLNQLKTQASAVQSYISQLSYTSSSILLDAYTQGTGLLDEISKVPDNNIGGTLSPFTYNNFDGSAGTIPSTFPTILGTVDPASPGAGSGLVNISFAVLNGVNEQVLKALGQEVDTYSGQVAGISGIIDPLVNTINNVKGTVGSFNDMIGSMSNTITPYMKIVTTVVTAFFGVFIGLGVIGIIGVVLMTFCDKYSCRYLIYFVCLILTILGIISFLLAFLFSIITPVLYLGCDFINTSISSQSGFSTNLQPVLGNQLSNMVKVCLPGGSGEIIKQLNVNTSAIDSLQSAVDRMNLFDATTIQNTIEDTSLDWLRQSINLYYYTSLFDFNSTSNQNFMAKIATPSNYPSCSTNGFTSDSWIPSISQSNVGCGASSGRKVDDTQCGTTLKITGGSTATAPNDGCYGCLDTSKILYNDPSGTPMNDVKTRYGNPVSGDCLTWVNDMQDLWNNYYDAKKIAYTPVNTRVDTVLTKYNTPSTGYKDRITAVGSAITSAKSSLTSIAQVFDPNTGMIAGLNCLVLGQDINLIALTTCTKFFNTFFYLRLVLGIAAFGILFTMCCSVCSGVRAFKHLQRRGSILPNIDSNFVPGDSAFGAQQSTMAALNQKY